MKTIMNEKDLKTVEQVQQFLVGTQLIAFQILDDNALVESKNGHVIRKQFGHAHIPQHYANQVNAFNECYLNAHINYHRPCLFPVTVTDAKGKERKTYPYDEMMTPYEKFKSLPDAKDYLKPGITFEILDKAAYAMSDNDSAELLQ